MKERPIVFNSPMVRALLDGSKSQTRRIVKGQAPEWATFTAEEDTDGREFFMVCGEKEPSGLRPILDGVCCPYGQPGDRLWVREAWKAHTTFDHLPPRDIPQSHVWYLADDGYKAESRTRASMHMPRWASRILLEIVSVRVERLQDIGVEDIEAEGGATSDDAIMQHGCLARVLDFTRLWEGINGAGSWEANPWVWVVEFKRVTP